MMHYFLKETVAAMASGEVAAEEAYKLPLKLVDKDGKQALSTKTKVLVIKVPFKCANKDLNCMIFFPFGEARPMSFV